ncbi:MAG: hypothetical protein [Chaetfec virus UA24_144]|nr:MAG: hypothetical protein [Chaetfec virus UA24_144]
MIEESYYITSPDPDIFKIRGEDFVMKIHGGIAEALWLTFCARILPNFVQDPKLSTRMVDDAAFKLDIRVPEEGDNEQPWAELVYFGNGTLYHPKEPKEVYHIYGEIQSFIKLVEREFENER